MSVAIDAKTGTELYVTSKDQQPGILFVEGGFLSLNVETGALLAKLGAGQAHAFFAASLEVGVRW